MVSDICPIIGIGLFYTNGYATIGSSGECELSFLIDGPGGERITDIDIIVGSPKRTMNGLEVCVS